MSKLHLTCALLAAQLFTQPSAWAELRLPDLVVSTSRSEQPVTLTPAGVTVISGQEIRARRARHLAEVLRGHGGIQLNGEGDAATLDMRGFGPSAGANTLILLNGRRLNNSSDRADPDLGAIDLRQIDRIEIIQGSTGVLYGNQAVGGLINIITLPPRDFEAELHAGAGDYDGYQLRASLGNRLNDQLSYRISADKRRNHNYRDNNLNQREQFDLGLDYTHHDGRLFLEQQGLRDQTQLPGSLFPEELAVDRQQSAAAYQGDFSDNRTGVSRLGLEQDLGANWSFAGEYTYRKNDRDFQISFRAFPGSLSTQERTVRGFNPRLIGRLPMPHGELQLTAGADFERTDYSLLTSFGPQLLDQSIDAYYAQLTLPLAEAWTATLGGRRAWVENRIETDTGSDDLDDAVGIGSFGLVYRPNNNWRLFARADQNYRFATVDEHTNVLFGQPVGLKNQSGISYESGVEWSGSQTQAKLMLYRLDLDDEISFDASGFVNTNLDRTRRQGLAVETGWSAMPSLTLGASFTYTDPEISAGPFTGKRIPLVAERIARLSADWEIDGHWSLFGELQLSSERVLSGDFANEFPTLGGYGLVNGALGYDDGPWQAGLRIDNLLDKRYFSSGAVGFDEEFVSRDAYFPAAERRFWLTLTYDVE